MAFLRRKTDCESASLHVVNPQKIPPRRDVCECLIFDGDRVWQRTAIMLSFARVWAETTGDCPARERTRENLLLPKSSGYRLYRCGIGRKGRGPFSIPMGYLSEVTPCFIPG